jgi:SAM-dependent methyltransferase
MPDPLFAAPRLAAIYDHLEAERRDLDAYAAIVDELGARSVLDVGCGTGTFACLLARRGHTVVGVDPAAASLAVARSKPEAADVQWVLGDATTLPPLAELPVDVATMTGNVAQVFVTDEAWAATLGAIRAALRAGGHFVFESREPARQAWLGWDRAQTDQRTDIPSAGPVRSWTEVVDVSGPLVTFRQTYEFEADGAVLTSDSTLRFRGRDELARSLGAAGFTVDEVRDAPDRPGRELVFIARRS